MCFAPQRRALFRHLNFQKWSEPLVFCTFWLGNVLRATTACTFSTSQLPKVVRRWGVLYLLTWKCASRYNGVQFFIAPVTSWLRTRRFSEPTFRPSWATNHWKNTVFRDFPTFSRICIFFLLILSLLTLLTSAFQLSILSEVSLLNFLRLILPFAGYHFQTRPHSSYWCYIPSYPLELWLVYHQPDNHIQMHHWYPMDIYGPKVSHLVTATIWVYIIYIIYIYIYIIYIIYILYIIYIILYIYMRCFNPRVLLSSRGHQLSLFGPGRAAAADAKNVRGPRHTQLRWVFTDFKHDGSSL